MRAGDPGGERERGVALAAVGAEAGGDRVGGREQQPVGAGAVAVGHDHDLRARRVRLAAPSSASSSAGSSVGQSPGMHSTRSNPSSSARRDAEADRGALAVLGGVVDHDRAAARAPSSATEGSPVTTIVRSIAAVSRERGEHVADHRPRELQPQRIGDARAEALLGLGEALDGQDRGGAHLPADDSGVRDYQPSSIRPTVTPGPIVTIRPRSPGAGSRRAIVSAST